MICVYHKHVNVVHLHSVWIHSNTALKGEMQKKEVRRQRENQSEGFCIQSVDRVVLLHNFSTTVVFVRSFSVFWFEAKTKKLLAHTSPLTTRYRERGDEVRREHSSSI